MVSFSTRNEDAYGDVISDTENIVERTLISLRDFLSVSHRLLIVKRT